jgi:hypothetical protein
MIYKVNMNRALLRTASTPNMHLFLLYHSTIETSERSCEVAYGADFLLYYSTIETLSIQEVWVIPTALSTLL